MTRATWLPIDAEMETEYTLVPDLVADEIGYVRTGLLDARGRMILKRVTPPVGFLADHSATHYAVDTHDDPEPGARCPELEAD
jgi:hypothetical protein